LPCKGSKHCFGQKAEGKVALAAQIANLVLIQRGETNALLLPRGSAVSILRHVVAAISGVDIGN
jgi:hypothetical protein